MEVRLCRESEGPRVTGLLGPGVQAGGRWEAEVAGDC